jgi:chromate transporter
MKTNLLLTWTFFKFGMMCIGGGYVLVPLLFTEFVENQQLISKNTFGNLVSIAQVTPGPIGINTATYVGFLRNSFIGAAFATLGLVLPALIVGALAVNSINRWKDNAIVKGGLQGARLAATALVVFAAITFLQMSVFIDHAPADCLNALSFQLPAWLGSSFFSAKGMFICALSIIAKEKFNLTTTPLILLSALVGALL